MNARTRHRFQQRLLLATMEFTALALCKDCERLPRGGHGWRARERTLEPPQIGLARQLVGNVPGDAVHHARRRDPADSVRAVHYIHYLLIWPGKLNEWLKAREQSK